MQLKIDLINALFIDLWSLSLSLSLSIAGDITYNNYSTYGNLTMQTHFLNDSPSNANLNDIKLFSCMRCQRTYKLKKTLNRHMNHECGKDKIHSCSICSYRTHRNDRLLAHGRIVHPTLTPQPQRKFPKIIKYESLAKFPNF